MTVEQAERLIEALERVAAALERSNQLAAEGPTPEASAKLMDNIRQGFELGFEATQVPTDLSTAALLRQPKRIRQ